MVLKGWLKKIAIQTDSEQILSSLKPQFAAAAQQIYDKWDQSDSEYGDPELGFGGICQDIAAAISDVINNNSSLEATTMSAQCGEQHVWAIVKTPDGIYEVDIPPCVYETGGGYNWQKIPEVTFGECDIVVTRLSGNPEDWPEYAEEY